MVIMTLSLVFSVFCIARSAFTPLSSFQCCLTVLSNIEEKTLSTESVLSHTNVQGSGVKAFNSVTMIK